MRISYQFDFLNHLLLFMNIVENIATTAITAVIETEYAIGYSIFK